MFGSTIHNAINKYKYESDIHIDGLATKTREYCYLRDSNIHHYI